MEKTNVLTLCITLVVGIILAGSLLIPVLNDATKTEETFDNTGFSRYQMKVLEDGDEWIHSNGSWTYNGDALTSNNTDAYSIVFTNNLSIRENGTGRGTTYNTTDATTTEVEVTDSANNLIVNTGNTIVFEYGYGAVPSGDLIMKDYTPAAYLKKDTVITVTGVTALSTDSASVVLCTVTGSIEDGFTATVTNVKNSSVSDITIGDITVNAEQLTDYVDLYKFTNVQFDITGTLGGSSITKTATYSTFVMPKEVTAELTNHLTPGEIALMGAIPIMVIVALLMAAVGAIALRRND